MLSTKYRYIIEINVYFILIYYTWYHDIFNIPFGIPTYFMTFPYIFMIPQRFMPAFVCWLCYRDDNANPSPLQKWLHFFFLPKDA